MGKKTVRSRVLDLNPGSMRVRHMNGVVPDKRITAENMTKIAIFMDSILRSLSSEAAQD